MQIGHIEALFRYPVKSMAGERLETAILGWHGIEGDHSGMLWLAARRLPSSWDTDCFDVVLYPPQDLT
jgi:uncharacterized protein YcbX